MSVPAFSAFALPEELSEYHAATPDRRLELRRTWAVRWGGEWVRGFGSKPVFGPRGAWLREQGLVDAAVRAAEAPCPCPNDHGTAVRAALARRAAADCP